MQRLDRLGRVCALAYVVVSLATILGGVALAPWFDWTTNALSDLGAAGRATRPVFNGGLILGGVLGVVVGGWLARTRRGLARVGGVAFVVTMCLRAGIGLFPVGTPPHTPVAIAYFVGVAVSLWLVGFGAIRASDAVALDDARLALAGGTLVPAVWLSWGFLWNESIPGLAIPEVLSSLGLLAYFGAVGARLRDE